MTWKPQKPLKETFRRGETPDPAELRGYYQVRLATGWLPPVRFFGHQKFFPVEVESPEPDSGGFNEFLGRFRVGRFKIAPAASALGDGQVVLQIIYNRPGNSFWLRPLTDELKKVGPDLFLGRGVIQLFGIRFNSFYFTVEKSGAEFVSGPTTEPGADRGRTGGKATTGGAARFRPDDDSPSAKPVISGRRAKVLRAMMASLIPRGGAFAAGAEDFDLIPRINQLIDKLDPAARLGLPAALLWIEFNSLIRTGHPLTALSRERATRLLRGLEHSRLVLNRY
ncbi:MAG: hypothetical protein R6U29_09095, partial [Desulfosudaceae bacterium]